MEVSNEDAKKEIKENKPKSVNKYIELHFHLDGSIVLHIYKELAKIQKKPLPYKSDKELESHLSVETAENLGEFLKCFKLPLEILQTETCITEAIKLVADNIKSQGVIYVEIRFAPQFHTKGGLTQAQVVEAAKKGAKEASIKVNLILCFMRMKNNKAENEETLRLAKENLVKDGGVVAVDIAGDEKNNPVTDYKDLFEKCKEYGIPFTIHAGEADGAESVKNAINLGAKRIGHGTRAFEDPEVDCYPDPETVKKPVTTCAVFGTFFQPANETALPLPEFTGFTEKGFALITESMKQQISAGAQFYISAFKKDGDLTNFQLPEKFVNKYVSAHEIARLISKYMPQGMYIYLPAYNEKIKGQEVKFPQMILDHGEVLYFVKPKK